MSFQYIHIHSSARPSCRWNHQINRQSRPVWRRSCRAVGRPDRCRSLLSSLHFHPALQSRLIQFRLSHRRSSLRHTKRTAFFHSLCPPPQPTCPTWLAGNGDDIHAMGQELDFPLSQKSRCTNITQLPPEILARIFRHVYNSPVVIFPYRVGTAVADAEEEWDLDRGLCRTTEGGAAQEPILQTNTFAYGGNVVCTFEEEHTIIDDDIHGGKASAAPHHYPCLSLPSQAEDDAGCKNGEGAGTCVDQDCMSRISSRGSSRNSGRHISESDITGEDTQGIVNRTHSALGTATTTDRVIEQTTNRLTTVFISAESTEEHMHAMQHPNNSIDDNYNRNNVHFTHLEERYIVDNVSDNSNNSSTSGISPSSSSNNSNNNNNNNNAYHHSVSHHRPLNQHPQRKQEHHEIYIENDIFTLFNLCLTCRAFYAQAVRLLWRQRTLSNAYELKSFFETLTQALALATRPKDPLNRHQNREIEAALRIKSLTLLDMCLSEGGDSWASTTTAAVTSPSFVRHSFAADQQYDFTLGRTTGGGGGTVGGRGGLSSHMHLRHRSNSNHYPQHLDPYHPSSSSSSSSDQEGGSGPNSWIKWDQEAAGSNSKNASSSSSGTSVLSSSVRERASWAAGYPPPTVYGYDSTFWPSFSSSSSASTSQWAAASASSSSSSSLLRTTHVRQKSSSIYSDIISPRLLHMVAEYCHALTDLTICIQTSELTSLSATMATATDNTPASTVTIARRQPTITFSFLASALPSLKRLTLAGVVCDSDLNKTGLELLAFAKTIQPLETLNIRSCQGIDDETLMILAERSGPTLERLDFQGMDFKQTDDLTKVMKSFVRHCPNLASLTLSCMASLDLDESLQAFIDCEKESRLKELQILGHDHMVAQQQQGLDEGGAAAGMQQQSVTTMCHLGDSVLLGLARLPRLARLTLYCTGMTDLALIRLLNRAPCLEDLVLHEPTPVLHLPQLHSLTHHLFAHAPPNSTPTASLSTVAASNTVTTTDEPSEAVNSSATTPAGDPEAPEQPAPTTPTAVTAPFEYTSASFLYLILNRFRRRLSSLFIKISIETAQDWISQPIFEASDLANCLYQYQNAHSGEPAVVFIWKP